MDRVENLKQALPYLRRHRGRTFVIKLGGRVMEDEPALRSVAEDITLLHSVGIKVVVVHGGGPQMNRLARRLGVPQQIVGGRRVTDDETLDLAKMVFRGKLNLEVVAALKEWGTPSVGLSGTDGGLIEATRRPPVEMVDDDGQTRTVDFGNVGDIVAIDTTVLNSLLGAGFVPVVCSLAHGTEGGILNVNADGVAEQLAVAMGASKLFFATDQQGLLAVPDDQDSLISFCDRAQVAAMMERGDIAGGMKPKIDAALRAISAGVERVHVISAFQPSALLLEVFTNEGCGTLVVDTKDEAGG